MGRPTHPHPAGVLPTQLAPAGNSPEGAAEPALRDFSAGLVHPGRIRRIVLATAAASGVAPAELLGPRRFRRIAWPRQVAMLACREMTRASLPSIGRAFGRDHTTVIHGIRAARARAETPALLAAVRALLSPIPAPPVSAGDAARRSPLPAAGRTSATGGAP